MTDNYRYGMALPWYGVLEVTTYNNLVCGLQKVLEHIGIFL